ncbi:MAG: alpha/beta hydrolase [Candidatus Coproplasma sp.]
MINSLLVNYPLVISLSVVGGILLILISIFLPPYFIAVKVYKSQLVRTTPEKWGRECSAPDNEEQVAMYENGKQWAEENKEHITEVSITSEGYRLVGEYFDFGCDRAVIIIPGRTESLWYSYYFAQPYKKANYNVLVIDNRAHGLSEGKYDCVGLDEYKDILAWAKLLNGKFGNKKVLLHGICIGSATALYALTDKGCPDYMQGIVADGMYTTFYETFKNHMIEEKRPLYPFIWEIAFIMKLYSGASMTYGPIKCIDKLKSPILFLYSKEDKFSLPEKAVVLYDKCKADKELVWFEKGAHSHIRINNAEAYDRAIGKFIQEKFDA